jgi:hypothetical protein
MPVMRGRAERAASLDDRQVIVVIQLGGAAGQPRVHPVPRGEPRG